ncbi:MAG: STAS domain-containing protein [Atopobiaceae bacterium]|nr:STAS domain-containing protein [Atopobiaceae bacterium]
MQITKTLDGSTLTMRLSGQLNTTTADKLSDEIASSCDGVTDIVLDLEDLTYISSAGLRVILTAQKALRGKGSLVIRNASPEIYAVFDMTGFIDFLTIEQ